MKSTLVSAKTAVKLCVLTCLLFTGCVKPTAVDDLAKMATQASQLAPGVMSIGYDSCVAEATDAQLAAVRQFDEHFHIDQTAIDNTCKERKQTVDRLTKTFQLIVSYIQTLDKLASGGATTYDKSLTTLVGEIPGLDSKQQPAVTGLAKLVVDAFEKHWRERQAAKAIEQAQPHMLVLTKMFEDQIPPFLQAMLDNETASVGSLYRQIVARTPETSPILLTGLYSGHTVLIDRSRAGIEAFRKVVADIQTGHTALFNNRNKLDALDAMQELFQTASDVQKQVAAMQKAFK